MIPKTNMTTCSKVVLGGESDVGKSSLLERCWGGFTEGKLFNNGISFSIKPFSVNGKQIQLQMYDIAVGRPFKDPSSDYYDGAAVCIIVYAIDNIASFEAVDKWVQNARSYRPEGMAIFLVGAKADNESNRAITEAQAQEKAKALNIEWAGETSAKVGTGVEELLVKVANKCFELCETPPSVPSTPALSKPQKPWYYRPSTYVFALTVMVSIFLEIYGSLLMVLAAASVGLVASGYLWRQEKKSSPTQQNTFSPKSPEEGAVSPQKSVRFSHSPEKQRPSSPAVTVGVKRNVSKLAL